MIIVSQSRKRAIRTENIKKSEYAAVIPESDKYAVVLGDEDVMGIYPIEKLAEDVMSWMIKAEVAGELLFVMPTEKEAMEDW